MPDAPEAGGPGSASPSQEPASGVPLVPDPPILPEAPDLTDVPDVSNVATDVTTDVPPQSPGDVPVPPVEVAVPVVSAVPESQPDPVPPAPPLDPDPPAPPPPQAAAPPAAAVPPPVEDGPPPGEEGAPAWMMTFGDMMSLLLTFFILMYSMSSMETEKFRIAAGSIREAFGNSEGQLLPDDAAPSMSDTIPTFESLGDELSDAALDVIAQQLQNFVMENGLEEQVEVEKDNFGVHLRIKDAALFGPGSANIEQESVEIVEKLGDMLRSIDVPIVVAGHTDNVPIRSPVFRSNWELSAARAAGVARIFVSRGHLPETLTVEAYGEYRPLAENDTPEGRSENRRVEIYYAKEAVKTVLRERGLLRDGDEEPAVDLGEDPVEDQAVGASAAVPDEA